MLKRLIPNIFYERLDDGLDLFVRGLGFTVLHRDGLLAVVERDGAKAYLIESPEFAVKDRPQVTIETDTIAALHREVAARAPDLLHPESLELAPKPWGTLEFALRDRTDVCVVFRQA